MKQIRVNKNCSGCGLCIVNCPYLEENEDGNAQPVSGKAIKATDLENVKKVIADCPEKALEIFESGTTKKGKDGILDIINTLKKQCEEFRIPHVSYSDVKMRAKNYTIDKPSIRQSEYEFSSYEAAKSAARTEFSRVCYSETAYNPMLKRVFVEYKVQILKPYYTCSDEPESVYFKFNELIRGYLADAYAQICDIVGDDKLPESWKNFSVYPSSKDFDVDYLAKFDDEFASFGVEEEFKDLSPHGIDSYVCYVDLECEDICVGTTIFNNLKYKQMWSYGSFYEAINEFVKTLYDAINFSADNIEDRAKNCINTIYNHLEQKIKEEFKNKINELNKLI